MQSYLKPADYKGTRYKNPYPNDMIDPKLKEDKSYFLAVNNAMMADYTSNMCTVPFEFGSKRTFAELRSYAKGQQSTNKVKESVIGKKRKTNDGKFITKMNVSFDTYYKLPQMFDIMREKNMSQEYDVSVNCIDDDSMAAKESEREALKFIIDKNTKDFLDRNNLKPNFELNPEDMGIQTASDVDFYFETGGYTMQREIACKAACSKTKMMSDYKVLQDATFDDLITNTEGLTGWKTYIEESTKIPKIRKVNVERCIIPYSERNDFADITRAGEIRIMTIADIRKENPELTSAELLYLAKSFAWMNPDYTSLVGSGGWYNKSFQTGFTGYDVDPVSRCKILVLDSQWLSVDIETNIKNMTNSGRMVYKEVPFDYEIDKKARKDGVQKVQREVIKKYYSKWIIGTDMFLDYGVCKDVVYYGEDGNKTPRLDYFFVKTGNASLVERCIAIIDDIDITIIKQRNTLATLPASPAMAIQKDLLENVMLNGILQQPEDIIQGLIERGILYYNGLDDQGKPLYFAGGAKPIDYLDLTKIMGALTIYNQHIASKVNELREVLGLQNGADAGGTSAYQGLGQTKLAFQAANASLTPTFNSFNYLFKAAFEDIIKKWQIVAKDKDIKVSYSVLGNTNLNMLRLGKDFTNAEFNLEIDIAPSAQERAELLNDLKEQKALGVQSGGEQGLSASEYLYVWKKVMAGNIDEAMFVLAQIERKKKIAKDAKDAKAIQDNANVQQQSAAAAADMERANIEAKGQTQNQNTLLSELLKQNTMLMQQILAPTKVGETKTDTQSAEAIIQANNATVAQTISPPEQQPQMQDQSLMQPENEQLEQQQMM